MKFTAELLSSGKNTAGFEIPESVVESLGGGGHPKVAVTVNGFTFRTSIARMGGRYMLGVSAERRTAAGITPGDVLELDVVLDTAPRELEVPEPLAAAPAADPDAKAFWETLSSTRGSRGLRRSGVWRVRLLLRATAAHRCASC